MIHFFITWQWVVTFYFETNWWNLRPFASLWTLVGNSRTSQLLGKSLLANFVIVIQCHWWWQAFPFLWRLVVHLFSLSWQWLNSGGSRVGASLSLAGSIMPLQFASDCTGLGTDALAATSLNLQYVNVFGNLVGWTARVVLNGSALSASF